MSRRDLLIDTALEVIAEHGVAGTTHRRVAGAAGVPLGSTTYYFADLHDLLAGATTTCAAGSSGLVSAPATWR